MAADPKDKDVRPSGLMVAFGLTREQAIEMRRAVEYCEISAPQRWVMGDPIQLKKKDG